MGRGNKQRCDLLLDSLALDPDANVEYHTLIHIINPKCNQRLYRYTDDKFSTVFKDTRTIVERLFIPIKPNNQTPYIYIFWEAHADKRNGVKMQQSVFIKLDIYLSNQLALFITKVKVTDQNQAMSDCSNALITMVISLTIITKRSIIHNSQLDDMLQYTHLRTRLHKVHYLQSCHLYSYFFYEVKEVLSTNRVSLMHLIHACQFSVFHHFALYQVFHQLLKIIKFCVKNRQRPNLKVLETQLINFFETHINSLCTKECGEAFKKKIFPLLTEKI